VSILAEGSAHDNLRMSNGGFRVYIPDPAHGEGDWSEAGGSGPRKGPSAEFCRALEAEYGQECSFTSIGTGAALASYIVELLSDAAASVAVFYTGKTLKEGLEGWLWVYAQLSKLFSP
jgi:hypothetical protein